MYAIEFNSNFANIPSEIVKGANNVKYITVYSKGAIFDSKDMFANMGSYIRCYAETMAETYAKEKGYFYELLDESNVWEYQDDNGVITITAYNGSAENVTIPNKIDNKIVEAFGSNVFAETKDKIKRVFIPETVKYVHENFISGQESIKDVLFESPMNVVHIGKDAFTGTEYEKLIQNSNDVHIVGIILVKHFGKGDVVVPNGIKAYHQMHFR